MKLVDDTAIVTGGAQGIGQGITEELLSQDTSIGIAGIDEEGARETATELDNEFEAEAVAVHCDVTDAESVESMVESTVDRFSEVGILVNNAGVDRR